MGRRRGASAYDATPLEAAKQEGESGSRLTYYSLEVDSNSDLCAAGVGAVREAS